MSGPLKNIGHERFAQELAAGETVWGAYDAAGLMPRPFDAPVGCYVYLLIDPFTERVFYVGKGTGKRALSHARNWRAAGERNKIKAALIGRIETRGGKVIVHILQDGLSSDDALRLERLIIVQAHTVLTNIGMGEKPIMDRVRADVIRSMAQIKPLCVVYKENKGREHLMLWCELLTRLGQLRCATLTET